MALPTTQSTPKSVRVLLGALGLGSGTLMAFLALVLVLARRTGDELRWPAVLIASGSLWIAVWSFVALAAWLACENGVRAFLHPSAPARSFRPVVSVVRAFAIGFLITGVVGGSALALVPAHPAETTGGVKLVPVLPPPPAPDPLISYVVLFPNGSSEIPWQDRAPLSRFLHELAQCSGITVRLTAFVSSAPYPTEDERRNSDLLQHRLESVATVAKSERLKTVERHRWESLQAMRSKSGFLDRNDTQRLHAREAFNRRVEIRVTSYGDCGAGAQAGR
jgi:hypothetical protein